MKTHHAVAVRDQASRRVKGFTAAAVAGATALTAAFAGLAAASTHHAKKTFTPAKARARVAKTVTAPTPSLTPNGSTATPSTPSTPAQSQPVQPSTQAPVAVTGGS